MTQIAQPPGIRLLGGEMLTWSDDATAGRPPAGSGVLNELAARTLPRGGHALILGPHSRQLVDLVAERCQLVTCLLRSLPDARALAERYADHRGFIVQCGGFEKFGAREPYDVIVAFDGFERLASVDCRDHSWAESFERIATLLAPGGLLLLGAENELGLHRLVDAGLPASVPEDGERWPLTRFDRTQPAAPAEFAGRLRAAEMTVHGTYAAYPLPGTPCALIAVEWLDEMPGDGDALAAATTAACLPEHTGRRGLSDPRRLVRRAVRRGLGARLAPAWIAVARRAAADPEPLPLPEVLITDRAAGGYGSVTYELRGDGTGGWDRHLCGEPARFMAMGRVVREPGLLETPVPAGRLLDEILLEAAAAEDLLGLRELLTAFAGWLAGEAKDGKMPAALAFATTDNVVFDGARFALLDPSWQLAVAPPFDLALGRILRRFAVRMLADGHHHPWPPAMDADAIATTLCAMSGHPVDRTTPGRGAVLEAEIIAAQEGLPGDGQQRLAADLGDADAGFRELRSYRAALEANGRLRERLHAAKSEAEYLEHLLTSRERALRRTRAEVQAKRKNMAAIRNSLSFRAGRALTAPARWCRRVLRRAVAGQR